MSVNHVTLLANLTEDPKIGATTEGGHVKCSFRVACSAPGYAPSLGVTYVDVVVWGQQAIACHKHLVRGDRVLVQGRLVFREFASTRQQTPAGKQARKRYWFIRADEVTFLNCPRCKRALRAQADAAENKAIEVQDDGLDPDA